MGTGMVPTLVRVRVKGPRMRLLHATWLAAFELQGNRAHVLLSSAFVTFPACIAQCRTTKGPTSGLLFRTSK